MRAAQTGRLFVALWPDEAVREALVRWQRAMDWPAAARPTPAADLHLTLLFIGSIAAGRLDGLADALALPPAEPFDLLLDTVEAWRGGLVLLTPQRPPPALAALQARIADAVRPLELAFDERPYRPHVTLARAGQGASVRETPAPVRWAAQGYVLAMRDGPHYRVLRRC